MFVLNIFICYYREMMASSEPYIGLQQSWSFRIDIIATINFLKPIAHWGGALLMLNSVGVIDGQSFSALDSFYWIFNSYF